MKKILGIVVLGLLLSGNANATLKGIFEVELLASQRLTATITQMLPKIVNYV